jgi:hypothetical protein
MEAGYVRFNIRKKFPGVYLGGIPWEGDRGCSRRLSGRASSFRRDNPEVLGQEKARADTLFYPKEGARFRRNPIWRI